MRYSLLVAPWFPGEEDLRPGLLVDAPDPRANHRLEVGQSDLGDDGLVRTEANAVAAVEAGFAEGGRRVESDGVSRAVRDALAARFTDLGVDAA